jgi:hypothetical protein
MDNTAHKNRINPIFIVRHLVSDPMNSLISVGLCEYRIKVYLTQTMKLGRFLSRDVALRQLEKNLIVVVRRRATQFHCSCKYRFSVAWLGRPERTGSRRGRGAGRTWSGMRTRMCCRSRRRPPRRRCIPGADLMNQFRTLITLQQLKGG